MDWKATAAYLYILRLDRYALAWEYLRRNPDYREQWKHSINCLDIAKRWGCTTFENPYIDARNVCPQWIVDTPNQLHIIPASQDDHSDHSFSLWALGGSRSLLHRGTHMQLHIQCPSSSIHVRLDPNIEEGRPYAFVMRADRWLSERMRLISDAVGHFIDVQSAKQSAPQIAQTFPLSRTALIHARTLQALDGVHAGASQRDIAIVLFGDHRVQSDWTSDGELRAQVRYLIRRGKVCVNGGYRALLRPDHRTQGGTLS